MINRKFKGGMSSLVTFCSFGLLVITVCAAIATKAGITMSAEDAQTDLVLSNFAVYKEIDRKALGEDKPYFKVKDPYLAIAGFTKHLKNNMSLDDQLRATDKSFIDGQVIIEKFIIYNVRGDEVEILNYNNATKTFDVKKENLKSSIVKTPNGYIVDKTTVHSTVSFDKRTMFGDVIREDVSVDTDLTK